MSARDGVFLLVVLLALGAVFSAGMSLYYAHKSKKALKEAEEIARELDRLRGRP